MKKAIATSLICLALTACGSSGSVSQSQPPAEIPPTEAQEVQKDESDLVSGTEYVSESGKPRPTAEEVEKAKKILQEEQDYEMTQATGPNDSLYNVEEISWAMEVIALDKEYGMQEVDPNDWESMMDYLEIDDPAIRNREWEKVPESEK